MNPLPFPRPPWTARLGHGAGFLALTLYFFQPTWALWDGTLDYSNFGSYAYFTAKGFQYGKDVISMVGPYGFAFYGFLYAGYLFSLRLILDLAVKALLALLVLWIARQRTFGLWRWVWLFAIIVMSKLTEDLPFDFCVMLSGLYLILRFDQPGRPIVHCGLAVALAYLSLCKGTQTALVAATFVLVGFQALLLKRPGRLVSILGAYGGAYLLLWVLARQNPVNIPNFIKGTQELAAGYNAAMSLQESSYIFHLGVAIVGLLLIATACAAWLNRHHTAGLLAAVFLAGFTFVQWKHGYVRADGHVFIFFHFASIGALTALLITPAEVSPGLVGGRRLFRLPALAAFGLALYASSDEGRAFITFRSTLDVLPHNIAYLLHLKSEKVKLDADLQVRRNQSSFPQIRRMVGPSARVDFYGYSQAIIPLNGLHYSPRPMGGGSFNVYTPYLMSLNERFVLDEKNRPEYFIFKSETVDNRLSSQDDALTLNAIVANYEPRLVENGLVLLRARAEPIQSTGLHEVATIDFALGQPVTVPTLGPDELLLLSLDIHSTSVGRWRALLYKPAHLFMDIDGNTQALAQGRRIVAAMISQPVIFSPFIEENTDFLHLYTHSMQKTVRRFRLKTDQPNCYESRVRAHFYRMQRPAAPKDVDVADLLIASRSTLWNVKPERVTPADAPRRDESGRLVQLLHAPAALVFKLEGPERNFYFDYGLDPASYPHEEANGVTFLVELESPGGSRQEIFRRHLDPNRIREDQGNQEAAISLPAITPGTRLYLRTDPGPFGNTAWDWSYVARVKLERGPFLLDQFPGFSTPPAKVEGVHFGPQEIDGRSLFMLHAPGFMEFELNGDERTLTFSCGLLPGAYTEGGNSDGVAFVVQYRLPNGNLEQIFHRFVRPKAFPSERGDQEFIVTIPFHPPGTRLRLTADPGPSGDVGWDWSYISQLEFR